MLKVDIYSERQKEPIHSDLTGDYVVIKLESGAPIALARILMNNQIILSTVRDPEFKKLLVNMGIPAKVYVEVMPVPTAQSTEQIKTELNKLFIPGSR